jgi:plasmid stabilization system protein ParE
VIVRWSPLAIDRVVEIGEWIRAERPEAAVRIVDGLFDAAERLKELPLSVAFQSSTSVQISGRSSSSSTGSSTK